MNKIISVILSVGIALSQFILPVTAAESKPASPDKYDIRIESIFDTEYAYELNKYSKEIAKFINSTADRRDKNFGRDMGYARLEADDIDFTDTKKVRTYKIYGKYDNCEYNALLEDVLSSVREDFSTYRFCIEKNGTLYYGYLRNDPEYDHMGLNYLYKKFGGWHVTADQQIFKTDDMYCRCSDPETVRENINTLLTEYNEKYKDIKVIYCTFGEIKGGAIIFADGAAKYYYSYAFELPHYGFRKDTPAEIKTYMAEWENMFYFNRVSNSKKDVEKTWVPLRLYNYNELVYLIKTCREYGGKYIDS